MFLIAGGIAAVFARHPLWLGPSVPGRLNISSKKRSAINVHPLLHASCIPFPRFTVSSYFSHLEIYISWNFSKCKNNSKKQTELNWILTCKPIWIFALPRSYFSFLLKKYNLPCSSNVAAMHSFVAGPLDTIGSFENLQNLFANCAKPQIIIWLQPIIWQIF